MSAELPAQRHGVRRSVRRRLPREQFPATPARPDRRPTRPLPAAGRARPAEIVIRRRAVGGQRHAADDRGPAEIGRRRPTVRFAAEPRARVPVALSRPTSLRRRAPAARLRRPGEPGVPPRYISSDVIDCSVTM